MGVYYRASVKTIESDRRTIINYNNIQKEIQVLTHL